MANRRAADSLSGMKGTGGTRARVGSVGFAGCESVIIADGCFLITDL